MWEDRSYVPRVDYAADRKLCREKGKRQQLIALKFNLNDGELYPQKNKAKAKNKNKRITTKKTGENDNVYRKSR